MVSLIEKSKFYNYNVSVVISDNPDAKGIEKAKEMNIPVFAVKPNTNKPVLKGEDEKEYIKILKKYDVDLVTLAGFMRIIKKPFIESFNGMVLNIHPSLLPSFPGLDVHKKAIEYGVKYSGCTVHFVTTGIDSGPIIMQSVVPVYNDDTPESLSERILKEEHKIYPLSVYMILNDYYTIQGRRVLLDEEKIIYPHSS